MKKSLLLFLVLIIALGFIGCGAHKEKPLTDLYEEEPAEIIIVDEKAVETEKSSEAIEEMTTPSDVEKMEEPVIDIEEVVAKIKLEELEESEIEAEKMPAKMDIKEMKALERELTEHKLADAEAFKMKALNHIRIKVLNGNGERNSARAMRGKIETFGYTVERIDNAPKFTFSGDVIFYAQGFDKEAEALAKSIGGSIATKPLTWHSIFDIIVVTGKMK